MTEENRAKKEILMMYQRSRLSAMALFTEIEKTRALAEKVTVNYDGMPGTSTPGDKVGTASSILADLEKDFKAELDEVRDAERKVMIVIKTLDRKDYQGILTARYINGLKWEDIAGLMNYAERHVERLHGFALAALPPASELEKIIMSLNVSL